MIVLYLAAIVAANLLTAQYGPGISIVNAFLFIGLDLTSRDALHERWRHNHLWSKMFGLIATGSALSWVLNRNAGQIALASLIAFAAAGLVDLVVYQWVRSRFSRITSVNGSNVISAMVDSTVFPTIAFGGFLPWVTLGQWAAKVGGGLVWLWILRKRFRAAPIGEIAQQS